MPTSKIKQQTTTTRNSEIPRRILGQETIIENAHPQKKESPKRKIQKTLVADW